ncbi:MAG: helix-turn-helix transcriptional regulator [Hydrogenophaga sp.]
MDLNLAFPEQLSLHLRSLRKARGLTQAQLASRMGVGQSRISAIETDATKLTAEQLLRLLSALDASVVLRTAHSAPQTTSPRLLAAEPTPGNPTGMW